MSYKKSVQFFFLLLFIYAEKVTSAVFEKRIYTGLIKWLKLENLEFSFIPGVSLQCAVSA